MKIAKHRQKIGKFILIANIVIFILIFILYAIGGFLTEELMEILKFLIPIKSIYMTALVKFIIANKKQILDEKSDNEELMPLYKTVTNIFVYTHIITLSLMIVFCAFNIISFKFLINGIAILETFFGAYIGLIITDMFKVEKNEE